MSQGHCLNKWISASKIEPMVWHKVVEILLHPDSLRKGYEKMMEEEEEKQSRQIKHLETLQTGLEKINAKRARLQAVYLDPDIGMTKEEYLNEKKILDEQLGTLEEDIERIKKELAKVPTEQDLKNLEQMASRVRELLESNIDIADQDKRKIMEMLNLKVLIAPDRKMKIEGWFTPENNGLLSISQSSQRSPKMAGQIIYPHVKYRSAAYVHHRHKEKQEISGGRPWLTLSLRSNETVRTRTAVCAIAISAARPVLLSTRRAPLLKKALLEQRKLF